MHSDSCQRLHTSIHIPCRWFCHHTPWVCLPLWSHTRCKGGRQNRTGVKQVPFSLIRIKSKALIHTSSISMLFPGISSVNPIVDYSSRIFSCQFENWSPESDTWLPNLDIWLQEWDNWSENTGKGHNTWHNKMASDQTALLVHSLLGFAILGHFWSSMDRRWQPALPCSACSLPSEFRPQKLCSNSSHNSNIFN